MDTDEDEDSEEQRAQGGVSLDLVASYIAFARRAWRKRWPLMVGVLLGGIVLTALAFMYLPRTYTSTTVLMAQGSLLDANGTPGPLAGAEGLIMRHENLEQIIRDDALIAKSEKRRPALLKLKDAIFKKLFGELSDKVKMASLVGTLEVKLTVTVEKGALTIKTEWGDPQTAAEITELARVSFLRFRHTAEMSAFEEKMSILDQHAGRLRTEIGELATQVRAMHEQEAKTAREAAQQVKKDAAGGAPVAAPRFVRRPITADTRLPELTERLAIANRKLTDAEAERSRRMREEQAKLADLRVKLTPSHPQVIAQEERLAVASEVPSELALLRSEVKELQAEIDQRRSMEGRGSAGVGAALGGAGSVEPLPAEIVQLLDKDDLDPALTAQLSSAVLKYSRLREDVANARVELDLAEAAFNHRYQLVVPAEAPTKPTKPKPAVVWAGGLILSLLLALALPVLIELKRGVISESWQVHNLQLPVLAVLRLPPYSSDNEDRSS